MGLDVGDHEIDNELNEAINAWADFNEFGILPWNRNVAADEVILYWKNAIRYIDQMQAQARANLRGKRADSDIIDSDNGSARRRGVGRR